MTKQRPTEPWRGAWNNWIAPFHACPRCGASLNWQQKESVFDTPVIAATCCGLNFGAPMTWEPVPALAMRRPSSGESDG